MTSIIRVSHMSPSSTWSGRKNQLANSLSSHHDVMDLCPIHPSNWGLCIFAPAVAHHAPYSGNRQGLDFPFVCLVVTCGKSPRFELSYLYLHFQYALFLLLIRLVCLLCLLALMIGLVFKIGALRYLSAASLQLSIASPFLNRTPAGSWVDKAIPTTRRFKWCKT